MSDPHGPFSSRPLTCCRCGNLIIGQGHFVPEGLACAVCYGQKSCPPLLPVPYSVPEIRDVPNTLYRMVRQGLSIVFEPMTSAESAHPACACADRTNVLEQCVMLLEQNVQALTDLVRQLVQARQPTAPDAGKTPLGPPGVFRGMPGKYVDPHVEGVPDADVPGGPLGPVEQP